MRQIAHPCVALGFAVLALPAAALADPCIEANRGLTIIHYDIGSLATSAEDQARLEQFADVARYREQICIVGQADAQVADESAQPLAQARADTVAALLVRYGVPRDKIKVKVQQRGFTLWGALDDNQPNDRRVTVTHN